VKIVAVVSAKGGVGKTTVCANLSAALGLRGHPVLAVDLDPQNGLRFHMGLGTEAAEGIAAATLARRNWREVCVQGPPGVSVAPFGPMNESLRVAFEHVLANDPAAIRRQLGYIGLPADTIVMLDTPPGASIYMRQALTCADMVLVTTLTDAASYATLPTMHELIHHYCGGSGNFVGYAYVLNQVDRSRELSRDITEMMRADLGDRIAGIIHQDQSVAEALAFNRNVLEYDEHCRATHDFIQCAAWIGAQLQSQVTAS